MFVCNVDSWHEMPSKYVDSNMVYQCLQKYYSPDINQYILKRCYVGDEYDLESKIAMEFIGRHRIYEKFVRNADVSNEILLKMILTEKINDINEKFVKNVDISSEILLKMNRLVILTEKINDINDLF